MTNNSCDLCNQQSSVLHVRGRCHITAPLRAELDCQQGILTLYCYVPECNRVVARFLNCSLAWAPSGAHASDSGVGKPFDPIHLGM